MFMIIGGDGREYGPATVEQIHAWIAGGRANLDTKAKAVGTDEWRRLGDYAEFSTPTEPPVIEARRAAEAATDPSAALGPRGMRLVARLIDFCIRAVVSLPGLLLIGPETFQAILNRFFEGNMDIQDLITRRVMAGALVLSLSMFVLFLIQIVLLSTRGQTIGKILARVRIVRATDGTRAGFVRAWLLREFVPELIGFVPIIGPFLLSPLFTLVDACFIFRNDQRCIHDFIAGTRVVVAP